MDVFDRKMFRRIPFLTISLLVWLVLCFFYESAVLRHTFMPILIGNYFGISRSMALNGHFLRFATASFFHMNLGHFIGNAVGLFIFLTVLEYAAGSHRAAIIVLVSALGGAAGSLGFHWVQYLVGASTILFGVYGALGLLIFKYRRELGRFFALVAAIWFVNLAFSLAAGYMSLKVVDQGSHIGGFLAGAIAMIFMTRGRTLKELQNPVGIGMKIALIALVAVFAFSFYQEVYALWPLVG